MQTLDATPTLHARATYATAPPYYAFWRSADVEAAVATPVAGNANLAVTTSSSTVEPTSTSVSGVPLPTSGDPVADSNPSASRVVHHHRPHHHFPQMGNIDLVADASPSNIEHPNGK